MEIANMDLQIQNIRDNLRIKQEKLIDNYRFLRDNVEENVHLKEIYDEYESYMEDMRNCKKTQYAALKNLHKYLESIDSEIEITDQIKLEKDNEQKLLVRELVKIKKDINKLK